MRIAAVIGGPVGIALDLLLPRPCPGCGSALPWCAGCAGTLTGRPRLVALPESTLDAAARFALPPARALARYSGPARAAILAGKEKGRTDLPPLLGSSVGAALLRLRRASLVPDEVWIVPAPSRRSAARRRGGDPVLAMAGVAPCLYTARGARDSVGLDSAGRVANLQGRVRFRPSARPPPRARVVVLDDVLTSGATLLVSCRALSAAGVEVAGGLAVATASPWLAVR